MLRLACRSTAKLYPPMSASIMLLMNQRKSCKGSRSVHRFMPSGLQIVFTPKTGTTKFTN
uniref:Uncharacterized protein n=1 Tax=Arundo donax TaxID=35708 RepID=A0A0A9CNU2_ARUDO